MTKLCGFIFLTMLMIAGSTARAEECTSQYLRSISSALDEAGGLIGHIDEFPMGVTVYPVGSDIQSIKAAAWSTRGCIVPGVDFYVYDDNIDPGSLRGIAVVLRAMFRDLATDRDLEPTEIAHLIDQCLAGRPAKYDRDFRRRGSRTSNQGLELQGCFTEATASGVSRTYLRFMAVHWQ